MLQPTLCSPPRSPFKTAPNSSRALDDLVQRDYSLARVLREGPRLKGFELEVSQELERTLGRAPGGIYVAAQVFGRDLSAGTPSAGEVMIQETVQDSLIPVLRNRSVVVAMGATVLEGLSGNVRFPRQTATVPPAWLAENAPLIRADQAFDSVVLKPKRVAGMTAFSTTPLAQSTPGIEGIVRSFNTATYNVSAASSLPGRRR